MRAPWEDARQLAVAMRRDASVERPLRAALLQDSFVILLLWRLRCFARRWHIPAANHLLRRIQTVVFGIELGNLISLGRGVFFVHPIGVVVGGTARVGDRVRFMGANTVGTARDDGCPVIEEDVTLGAGARVLGPIRVGARSVIGANAVVLDDIPPDSVAVGMPARVVPASGRAALLAG